jgi:hypothetical protein
MNNTDLFRAFVFLLMLTAASASAQSNRTSCLCAMPVITAQPQSASGLCVQNSIAAFTVAAISNTAVQYQWQQDSVNLNDNSIFSGCSTSTLTILNPPAALDGKSFRCILTNCFGIPVVSDNAMLSLNIPLTDINADGVTNVADFGFLLGLYDGTCSGCREDITQDGLVNILDFLRLLGRFNQSCY